MSDNFQQCSHLDVEGLYDNSKEHLKDILRTQKMLQDALADKHGRKRFEDMTLKEVVDFWHLNTHALNDEVCEAFNALGGISDGIGSAAWKNWKADHSKTGQMRITDLSDRDMKELKMEVVDMLHFMCNYWLTLGGTAEEMYDMYFAKNKENIDRQKRGY